MTQSIYSIFLGMMEEIDKVANEVIGSEIKLPVAEFALHKQ